MPPFTAGSWPVIYPYLFENNSATALPMLNEVPRRRISVYPA